MAADTLRIGLLFGGRSAEHEVSLVSAKGVMRGLDRDKYEVVPICITRQGSWRSGLDPAQLISAHDITQWTQAEEAEEAPIVTLASDPTLRRLIPLKNAELLRDNAALDVIFPVLHGTYGEDGTVQGLFELANIPYVGCGVLGSALGMDKEKMKTVVRAADLPTVASQVYLRHQWERSPEAVLASIEVGLGYPCFVKPANLGSSIGISRAQNRYELERALRLAVRYDRKLIIERGITCRELECAVLGNDDPVASVVGEVAVGGTFFDYRKKYFGGSQKIIPAPLPQMVAEEVRQMAIRAFRMLDLSGFARVDFFLEEESGQIYFNEVNTCPALTEVGMYARLWQASGLSYPDLLDRLIALALERHAERQCSLTSPWEAK